MANRFTNALAIQQGACNPSGIALSIVDACREFRAEKAEGAICACPAIRLMVHQLAHICGANDEEISGTEYQTLTQACTVRAS